MRIIAVFLINLLILGVYPVGASTDSPAVGKTISVGVKGMTCGFCTRGIRKRFEKLPGVESAAPNLEEKKVVLQLKADQNVSDEEIKRVVDDSGYELTEINRGEAAQSGDITTPSPS